MNAYTQREKERKNHEELDRALQRNFEISEVNETNYARVFLVKYIYIYIYMHQIFDVLNFIVTIKPCPPFLFLP